MPIDYERMKRNGPKLKAILTRAAKKIDTGDRYRSVYSACICAIIEWEEIGCWPDNWSNWQRALDDSAIADRRPTVRLEDLQ